MGVGGESAGDRRYSAEPKWHKSKRLQPGGSREPHGIVVGRRGGGRTVGTSVDGKDRPCAAAHRDASRVLGENLCTRWRRRGSRLDRCLLMSANVRTCRQEIARIAGALVSTRGRR